MTTEAFFDTNVPLYLLAIDDPRADRAEALMSGGGVISVQVLNEFALASRRKHALEWNEIEALLAGFRIQFRVEPITVETQARAVTLARRHKIRIYDANILAAAQLAGCDTVWSEDMQDGLRVGGLTVRNPFA